MTKKNNSPMKKLIPAAGMLMVSAMMLASSTYAWFSMNRAVDVTGMQVKVQGEKGLVVANAATENRTYSVEATTTDTALKTLIPGSTSNLTSWVHSESANPAQANTQKAYDAATLGTNYVKHTFYIRSSTPEAFTVASLNVHDVTVTGHTTGTGEQVLSKSLRVGVKLAGDDTVFIYAPVYGASETVSANSIQLATGAYSTADGARASVTPTKSGTPTTGTLTTIPANTGDGIQADVYLWFEGEDPNCISNNLVATSSLETLTVTVEFDYTEASS
jgi:hypothetical protein